MSAIRLVDIRATFLCRKENIIRLDVTIRKLHSLMQVQKPLCHILKNELNNLLFPGGFPELLLQKFVNFPRNSEFKLAVIRSNSAQIG